MCTELLKIISTSCGSVKKTAAFVPRYAPITFPYIVWSSTAFFSTSSGDNLRLINEWPKIGTDGGSKKIKFFVKQYNKQ